MYLVIKKMKKIKDIFFEIPIKLNKFRNIQYFHGISTYDIINKIIKHY